MKVPYEFHPDFKYSMVEQDGKIVGFREYGNNGGTFTAYVWENQFPKMYALLELMNEIYDEVEQCIN